MNRSNGRQLSLFTPSTTGVALRLLATGIVLAAGCNDPGCNGGQNSGLENLIFFSNASVVVKKTISQNRAMQAWGPVELGTVSLLPLDGTQNIKTQYVAGDNPALLRDALYVFARDPRDYRDALTAISNDPDAWRTQTSSCYNPTAIGIPYPQQNFSGPPSYPTVGPFFTSHFWTGCDVPPPSVATPFGKGSIKSAYLYNRGACSTRVDYLHIIDQIQNGLWDGFSNGATKDGCADAEQFWSLASSYLTHSPGGNPDSGPTGGFIASAYLDAHVRLPGLSDTNLRFNVDYRFMLNDGILAVDPTVNSTDFNGTGSGAGGAALKATLETGIPQAISDGALGRDPYATKGQYFDNTIAADCDQVNGRPELPKDYTHGFCSTQISYVTGAVDTAQQSGLLAALGSTNPAADAARLKAKVVEDDGTNLRHWRCQTRSNPNGGDTHRCEYILRAERLIAMPGGVELVWFDTLQSSHTTALPVYLFLVENARDKVPSLCNTRSQDIFFREGFTVLNVGDRNASTSHSTGECVTGKIANFLSGLTFIGAISNVVNGP
jgi:hypothetical protein